MGSLFMLLGSLCYLAAFACGILILISAFQDEVWKGIVGFLCGLYLLYYGIVEFQHEKKPLILGLWLGGGILGVIFMMLGGGMRGVPR